MTRRQWLTATVAVVFFAAIAGGARVMFGGADERDLARILGPQGSGWLEHARIAAWQPDPNRKPFTYYLQRTLDESEFRKIAAASGLSLDRSAAAGEAVWELPSTLRFEGWSAPAVPAGAGLDARGKIGGATVYARWHERRLWFVAMVDEG